MNRKILLSGISIVASLVLVGGSAFALFDAQALATNNTFSAATPGLLVNTGSTANSHPSTGFSQSDTGYTATDLVPGYSHDFVFWLHNTTGDSVTFNLSAHFLNDQGDNATLNGEMLAQFTCTNHNNTGTAVTSGQHSITEWLAGSDTIGTLDSGDYARCIMNMQLPTSAGNDIAGKTVKFDTQIGINQTVIPTL